jgi:hypothetical protein
VRASGTEAFPLAQSEKIGEAMACGSRSALFLVLARSWIFSAAAVLGIASSGLAQPPTQSQSQPDLIGLAGASSGTGVTAQLGTPLRTGVGQMFNSSDTVVLGKVSNVMPTWNPEKTLITTTITVEAQDVLKDKRKEIGEKKILQFKQRGGQIGQINTTYSDMPYFLPGEEVLLFLNYGPGSLVTPVFDGTSGKVNIERAAGSDPYVLGLNVDIPVASTSKGDPNRTDLKALTESLKKLNSSAGGSSTPRSSGPSFATVAQPAIVADGKTWPQPAPIPPPVVAPQTVPCEIRLAYSFRHVSSEKAEQAKRAIKFAAHIWETQLTTKVPIVINVTWVESGLNSLGEGGPITYKRDFPGARLKETWYPIALANKMAGKDLEPNNADIQLAFDGSANWYFGTDGKTPPDKFDLVSVALHNIAHGLGIVSSMRSEHNMGNWGIGESDHVYPLIYDRFLTTDDKKSLLEFAAHGEPNKELAGYLAGSNVYFKGNADRVKLFTPEAWKGGLSLSHLCSGAYPAGCRNSLMSPDIGEGEAVHDPGPVILGILRDLGW